MGKTAFIFPGQGAQKAGMGKDFYEKYDTAKEVFDSASKWLDLDMKALCFEENDQLDLTEYTQAALVTTCLAMEKVVEEMGLHPDVTAGLSLGEYCAIEAAGGMDLKDMTLPVFTSPSTTAFRRPPRVSISSSSKDAPAASFSRYSFVIGFLKVRTG